MEREYVKGVVSKGRGEVVVKRPCVGREVLGRMCGASVGCL